MEFKASDYYRCLYRNLRNQTYLFIYACCHNETNQGKEILSKLVTAHYGNQELILDDEVIDMLIEEIE